MVSSSATPQQSKLGAVPLLAVAYHLVVCWGLVAICAAAPSAGVRAQEVQPLEQRSLLLPACTGTHPLTRRLLQTCTAKYTIQPGDGLDAIAAKFKTTRAAIMSVNPSITDPDQIQAGQVINIPNQPCSPPQPTCSVKYTVNAGDSLFAIATAYKTTLAEVLRANPSITDPNLILPGQVINIPNQPCTPRGPPALPVLKNGRCGARQGTRGAACARGLCCSRWGWCGKGVAHCDPTRGCNKLYGSCSTASVPVKPGFTKTDLVECGNRTGCRPGYCCNNMDKCSVLSEDCSPAKCQPGYGICYQSQADLQYAVDGSLAMGGPRARQYASTPTSNATLLSLYSFTTTAARVCAGQRAPCVAHTVQPGQTLEHIAALHGTTTWQLRNDNALLESGVETAQVALRRNDVLAVRPSPKPETLRWQWRNKAALVLGSPTYPRPCSGFSGFEQQTCFCHYHQGTGTYVWPFSSATNDKCRQAIKCKPPNAKLDTCPATTVADDLEFNGKTQCLPQPSGFECSTGDGCTSVHCFCHEFLLKPGTYQNPFDSTRSTGIICDFNQPGWYGGMVYCNGGYFDPYTRGCTSVPQNKIPYRRGYTSCEGVPDPDDSPLLPATGRRLHARGVWTRQTVKPCNRNSCCIKRKKGLAVGCIPCKGCVEGASRFAHVVSKTKRKCQCQVWGSCPTWFNKGCRFKKPKRN